ncbi:cation:proton antiporter [bacterium]|nr:cation:proton antiporter [bacterium]
MSLLRDLLVVIAASLVVVVVLRRLRVPPVVGFLVSGILIGPGGLKLVGDREAVEMLAEVGVALLLFTIGLKFSLREMLRLRHWVFGAGLLQVVLTIGATLGACRLFGLPPRLGVFVGFVVALSSTAIVLKLQEERGESDTPSGRLCLSVLIFQDLAVVPLLLLVPMLETGLADWAGALLGLLRSLALVALLLVVARLLIPLVLETVVRVRSPEVFVLTIIALAMGTAYVSAQAGLSLALGAFLAGIVISETDYSHHVIAQIMPVRDALSSLFFISIGMLVSPSAWLGAAGTLAVLIPGLVVLKALVVVLVGLCFGLGLRNGLLAGLALAQVGEFSFVLLRAAGPGLLDETTGQLLLSSSVATMLLTPLLMALAPAAAVRLQAAAHRLVSLPPPSSRQDEAAGEGPPPLSDHVVIVGYGVNGRNVARVLARLETPFVVVELNPYTAREVTEAGTPLVYGDACQEPLLRQAGVERARVLVVAVADPLAVRCITAIARGLHPTLRIIVRTRFVAEVEELTRLGADEVVPEEFETSLELVGRVMAAYGAPAWRVERAQAALRRQGYLALRDPACGQAPRATMALLLADADVEVVELEDGARGVGATLRQLDLRARTGAAVVALVRRAEPIANPSADEALEAGDRVVLMGDAAALTRAETLLTARPEAEVSQ